MLTLPLSLIGVVISLLLNGQLGMGGGYSGDSLPLFRDFYAGGIGSVRGFETGSLGPKAQNSALTPFSVGGDRSIVGNVEMLFPFPGTGNDKSVRLSTFVDAGMVSGPYDYLGRYRSLTLADLRYSFGTAVTWYSPMGPIKISLAKAINASVDDKTQMFQFQLGNVF